MSYESQRKLFQTTFACTHTGKSQSVKGYDLTFESGGGDASSRHIPIVCDGMQCCEHFIGEGACRYPERGGTSYPEGAGTSPRATH